MIERNAWWFIEFGGGPCALLFAKPLWCFSRFVCFGLFALHSDKTVQCRLSRYWCCVLGSACSPGFGGVLRVAARDPQPIISGEIRSKITTKDERSWERGVDCMGERLV
eukprot:06338_5